MNKRSDYYFKLDENAKRRYEQKLFMLDLTEDPFSWKENEFQLTNDVTKWPELSFADIFVYLINFPSDFTKQSLKSYKSLESYKYVLSGLVFNVQVTLVNEKFLVVGRVRHGQSMFTKTPNHAWIGLHKTAEIINAHCSCMAGLGETCSHVGALMFYLQMTSEYCKRNLENACTSTACTWLPPSIKNVQYSPLSEIDFTDPHKKFTNASVSALPNAEEGEHPNKLSTITKTTKEEQSLFYNALANSYGNSAILRLVSEHNEKFIPVLKKLKTTIFKFYDKRFEDMPYHELIQQCLIKYMTLKICPEEVKLIESHTVKQSKSNLWFEARQGVITASKFKSCCHSDFSQPSKSLIMQICYPAKCKFTTQATQYGIENEKVARDHLEVYLRELHQDATIKDCGLFRSCEFPFLGATPDGLMSCSCCAHDYVIEIKCPFKCTQKPIRDLALNDPAFCIRIDEDGSYRLKTDHAYYYQIQLQMRLTEIPYCYFFVYGGDESLFELVGIDIDFLNEKINTSKQFFILAILPELIGHWYSRPKLSNQEIQIKSTNNDVVCTCQKPQQKSDTIICSDNTCVVKEYHLICLGLDIKPKSKWVCPYCSRKRTHKKK